MICVEASLFDVDSMCESTNKPLVARSNIKKGASLKLFLLKHFKSVRASDLKLVRTMPKRKLFPHKDTVTYQQHYKGIM